MTENSDKLKKLDKKILQKEQKLADWKLQKEMDFMDKQGFFDDPEEYDENIYKNDLLEKYEVFETKQDKKGNILKTGKINTANLGKLIYETGYYFTMKDNREIWSYIRQKGCWEKKGETGIRFETEYYLGEYVKEYHKNEVVGWIRDHNYKKRSEIKTPLHLINLANGVLNMETMELLPHAPEYLFLSQINVKYDHTASYKDFENFLKHITMKEGEPRKKVVKSIQEYFGYGLLRSCQFKTYTVFDGSGDNAKTVLLNVVIAFFGSKNNTSVSLQDLNNRPFAKKQLYAKHVNVSDDLPKKALRYTGVIKQITGNSMIWADIKGHKDGIDFYNHAKPWYGCNELPETNDYSDAFFSRQQQYTLLNRYLPKGDPKIDNITVFERDINLTEKLTTPEQLSGILNYILIGLKRLLKNMRFSDEMTTDEKRTTWMRKTNPVHAFIEDEIEIADQDWGITVEDFFSELVAFCERNEFDIPTARKPVTTRLLDENIGVRKVQKTINGVPRVWCWIGIKSATNTGVNHYFGRGKDGVII